MRPAPALRPSIVSRVLGPRRVPSFHRHVSRQANRSVAELLQWRPADKADNVVVNGFVRSVRPMKSHRFVALGDGSSLAPLQALVAPDDASGLAVGAAVRLTGSWVASPGASQSHELHVSRVEVLGPSDAKTFPIQKKYQTPEYLRTLPHLRPRTPVNALLLRLRSEAIASLTHFFAGRAFTQTHPPIITSSDCEGAGEVFSLTPASDLAPSPGPDAAPAPAPAADQDASFFRDRKFLTVSTQLHLEALAQAVGNVWTLSPVFRAERSDTSRHLSEFYMLEAEMAFVDDLAPVMDLLEDMLRSLTTTLFASPTVQDLLSRPRHTGSHLVPADDVRRRWEGLMRQDWPRITYSDAVALLQQNADRFKHKPTWGAGLQAEHEKYLAEHVGGGEAPVFITNYPQDIKAFYMRESHTAAPEALASGPTVDCFDLLVPEFLEIAGGSMREHQLAPLLDAMKRQGFVTPPLEGGAGPDTPSAGDLDWYVDLRRWGCPPHGGFGLGFDRLLSYLAGVQTVRDMVSFPRWYGRCDC
ncbi:hypothetical protein C8A05DRAFT_18055 [Staphylotrichum tortipilum]|uniref:asparagine--tRNA ligase n=1 Tax=Staphylotrichum tortipilum TaxID=2831512 RepID=A0AAN6RQS3_9PEZI|nr:hypothetical protein C8A05DRAFT_18055 [Staphylotrichum longicolle]